MQLSNILSFSFDRTQAYASLVWYFMIFNFIPRTDFVLYFCLYTLLFISYFFLQKQLSLATALKFGIVARIIAAVSVPELSDDFYRFLWDGNLTIEGINPYLHTPRNIINNHLLDPIAAQELFNNMNSPDYFTVYPPLNQFLFAASVALFGISKGLFSAFGIKVWILLAEIGTLLILPKLLKIYDVNPRNALLYTLNPLVIIELCGNAHYEGVMIFLLLVSIYLFKTKRMWLSAMLFGLAASIKLLPLLFLPLLFRKMNFIKLALYVLVVLGLNLFLFIPFASYDFLTNLSGSIQLYFHSFQFNSFFYTIISDLSFTLLGINKSYIAPALLIFPIAALAWFSLSKTSMLKNLPAKMSMTQAFYYFFSAVVHPWYLTTVLALSVFQPVKYILAWTYVAGLSYFTYRTLPYEESAILVALEYLVVFILLFTDWILLKRKRYGNK